MVRRILFLVFICVGISEAEKTEINIPSFSRIYGITQQGEIVYSVYSHPEMGVDLRDLWLWKEGQPQRLTLNQYVKAVDFNSKGEIALVIDKDIFVWNRRELKKFRVFSVTPDIVSFSLSDSGWISIVHSSTPLAVFCSITIVSPTGGVWEYENSGPGAAPTLAIGTNSQNTRIYWIDFQERNWPAPESSENTLLIGKPYPGKKLTSQIVYWTPNTEAWHHITSNFSINHNYSANSKGQVVWIRKEITKPNQNTPAQYTVMLYNEGKIMKISDQASEESDPIINEMGTVVWHKEWPIGDIFGTEKGTIYMYKNGKVTTLGSGYNPCLNQNGWVLWYNSIWTGSATQTPLILWRNGETLILDNMKLPYGVYCFGNNNWVLWRSRNQSYLWKP
ncbi:hypothetical protein J7K05_02850 [bacterium]|nr:hypothetical protein [bacterium]